jgi:hypothetical protein
MTRETLSAGRWSLGWLGAACSRLTLAVLLVSPVAAEPVNQPIDPPATSTAPDLNTPLASPGRPGGPRLGQRLREFLDRREAADAPARRGGPDLNQANPPSVRPLAEDELEEALNFSRENMPNFYGLFLQSEGDRRRFSPRLNMAFRLLIDAQRNGDTELYDVVARQLRLRDEFIGIVRDGRDAAPDQREQVRAQLREKTRELVDAWLQQRELRLARMEAALAEERRRLEADRSNPDALIRGQFQRLMDDSKRFMLMSERVRTATQPTSDAREQLEPLDPDAALAEAMELGLETVPASR